MELKKELESLLFSSGKMMSESELAELTNSSENQVKEALENLKKEYDDRDTSLMLVQSGGNWKLTVREKYIDLVTKIVADTELPFPVLETLAVIAYKAPLLQAEVIKIRGTNAYEHIGLLVKEEFVDKKKEGRSFKLSLTPKFFKYFDVEGERDIKEALKNAKVPERVGDLKVVDVPEKEEKEEDEKVREQLGDLEVIDEPKEPEEEEKASIENNKPDKEFLNHIDKRIDDVTKRNDDLDSDDLFKRQEEVTKEMEKETKAPVEEEEKKEEVEEEKTAEPEEKKEVEEEAPAEEPEAEKEPEEEEKKEE